MREDPDCNLGWRIVLEALVANAEFEAVVKKTLAEPDRRICTLVDADIASKVRTLSDSFRKLVCDEDIGEAEVTELLKVAGYEPAQIAKQKMRDDFYSSR